MEVEAEAEAIEKKFLFLKWKRKLWKILQSNGSGSGSFKKFFHKMEAEAEAPSKFTASITLLQTQDNSNKLPLIK